jgi:hypothetical protein
MNILTITAEYKKKATFLLPFAQAHCIYALCLHSSGTMVFFIGILVSR